MTTIESQVYNFIKKSEKDVNLYENDYPAFYEKYKSLLPAYPNGEYKKTLMKDMVEARLFEEDLEAIPAFPFYQKEYDLLRKIFFDDKVEYGVEVMALLMLWKKQHPHEGGWIEYNAERTLHYTFSSQIVYDIIHHETTFQDLVAYGFDMRVIGSKNPIVCYNVPTADEDEKKGKPLGYMSQSNGELLEGWKDEWREEMQRRERI